MKQGAHSALAGRSTNNKNYSGVVLVHKLFWGQNGARLSSICMVFLSWVQMFLLVHISTSPPNVLVQRRSEFSSVAWLLETSVLLSCYSVQLEVFI